MTPATLLKLAKTHGTPLFVVDHAELRRNYATFRKHFPRVQVYYAVKVNSDPAIVETFYKAGGSFDVASMQEFHTVHHFIEDLPKKTRQDFIWDKIIYANPIMPTETLRELDGTRVRVRRGGQQGGRRQGHRTSCLHEDRSVRHGADGAVAEKTFLTCDDRRRM